MSLDKFFGRKYVLKLGDKTFKAGPGVDGLDIKFNVKASASQICRRGSIDICGLSGDTINSILRISALSPGDARQCQINVKLQAGYENVGMVDIIDGWATYARVGIPPESWLHIEVDEINTIKCDPKGVEILDEMKLSSVAQQVFSAFGYSFDSSNLSDKKFMDEKVRWPSDVMDFHRSVEVMRELARYNWVLCVFGKTVYAYDAYAISKVKGTPIDASSDNGLITVSSISAIGCTVRMFLQDSNVRAFQQLKLKSKYNSQANGNYRVWEKNYIGHYFGNEWYTDFTCAGKVS